MEKRKKLNIIIYMLIIVAVIMMLVSNNVYARPAGEGDGASGTIGVTNPSETSGLGDIYNNTSDTTYNSVGGKIIGLISYVCYGAAVIILIYKGIGLMKAAPGAKADAKKELINYAIGAAILFAVATIIKIVGNYALTRLFV